MKKFDNIMRKINDYLWIVIFSFYGFINHLETIHILTHSQHVMFIMSVFGALTIFFLTLTIYRYRKTKTFQFKNLYELILCLIVMIMELCLNNTYH